jgi:hypothetical protein
MDQVLPAIISALTTGIVAGTLAWAWVRVLAVAFRRR